MRNKIISVIILVAAILLLFKFCEFKKQETSTLENSTNLIQQQIVNVGKLIVLEEQK